MLMGSLPIISFTASLAVTFTSSIAIASGPLSLCNKNKNVEFSLMGIEKETVPDSFCKEEVITEHSEPCTGAENVA